MALKLPSLEELKNESDVEQKLIGPLLIAPSPDGFGIPLGCIHTKASIRRFKIGKGSSEKLYFPDYLLVVSGMPLAVIEAKAPGEDLQEAFREARLYAAELNAIFPTGQNPLTTVIASDGQRTLAGTWDHNEPDLDISLGELTAYSEKMASLQKLLAREVLEAKATSLNRVNRPTILRKPRRLIGGAAVQQEELNENSFGATIAADCSHIFNPISQEDRAFIAKYGYIPSLRRGRYVDPIDRVIRAAQPPSIINATAIEDTGSPKELIKTFTRPRPLEHQVLLLVGSVGSGKTTFVDHLYEVALPREVIEKSLWVRVNMNMAPISATEIYDWLRKAITSGCQANTAGDFSDLDVIERVFAVELNKFRKGTGKLYQGESSIFRVKLAEQIDSLQRDLHVTAVAHARYCTTERGKLLVIVLDNCDKRSRDEQLVMFQAAQWVQSEFRALVIMPLREETYDNHRDQPPLDTALKDLVFRIEPPMFQQVLVSRVQLALNEMAKVQPNKLHYDLPNGFHVEYPASDQAFYLTSILKSIFEHDRYIRRMIVGLAARNIRRALEIFLEFCTSGHIGENHILKIRQAEGQYALPLFLVTRVLLRMNRRFYDSDFSYLKNVFAGNHLDPRITYFVRLMILRWLHMRFSHVGPLGIKGYFPIWQLKSTLGSFGAGQASMDREIVYLLKAQCIVSEDFRIDTISDETLVRLAPAGWVHLELLGNIDYLSAVSEDTYYSDEALAQRIAGRIRQLEVQYQASTSLSNATDVITYLEKMRTKESPAASTFLHDSVYDELTNLSICHESIARFKQAVFTSKTPWAFAVETKYPVGTMVSGTIQNRRDFGIFVELEPGITGLVHVSKLPKSYLTDDGFTPGELVNVRISSIDFAKSKISMDYVSRGGEGPEALPSGWPEELPIPELAKENP